MNDDDCAAARSYHSTPRPCVPYRAFAIQVSPLTSPQTSAQILPRSSFLAGLNPPFFTTKAWLDVDQYPPHHHSCRSPPIPTPQHTPHSPLRAVHHGRPHRAANASPPSSRPCWCGPCLFLGRAQGNSSISWGRRLHVLLRACPDTDHPLPVLLCRMHQQLIICRGGKCDGEAGQGP